MKKTKIIATLGPASSGKDVLKEMILEGVNVCRLNFSHGSHDDHAKVIKVVRDLNQDLGTNVALLADLQGPKIRTGEIENNGVLLEEGKKLTISAEEVLGTAEHISINYKDLPNDVNEGEETIQNLVKLIPKRSGNIPKAPRKRHENHLKPVRLCFFKASNRCCSKQLLRGVVMASSGWSGINSGSI